MKSGFFFTSDGNSRYGYDQYFKAERKNQETFEEDTHQVPLETLTVLVPFSSRKTFSSNYRVVEEN